MDEGTVSESIPDLKDIEAKIGRKTPEGLLRWMREESSSLRADAKLALAHDTGKETGMKSLDEKIRKLKMEMAHLRSVDVKILQQLLAVHEGIEAVKWLFEERSTLTSRCSSLTSSQYSLGEGPDTSWRGSWSSLQDPNDKLDNISIGSYLDTLADDMDEYCPSKGPEFNSTIRPGSFCVEFACSPCVCVGSLRVLRLPPTVQRHATCVNVRVNGCLSLCVSPATDWRPVQGVPCLSPYDSWDRLPRP
uniref:Leucine rich adaptor protein 1 n=1 Tax=Pundamilia nyererei TaxID=303518 RepID=A0A3B4GB83_9CICH